jgi:hypothetical protein
LTAAAHDLAGFVPIRLWPQNGAATVTWCHVGDAPFAEPFFQQTVDRHQGLPGALRTTPVETLLDVAAKSDGLELSGLLFHLSRCGSTLISQMLAASRRHTTLSEPTVVDDIVRAAALAGVEHDVRIEWLRAAVAALGRRRGGRGGRAGRLFVKVDPLDLLDLSTFLHAFPGVPWIFLYRDPLEVLVSQQRNTSTFLRVGTVDLARLGLGVEEALEMPAANYRAHVLGNLAGTVLAHLERGGRLVEYRRLPGAIDDVLTHFGVTVTAAEHQAMIEVSQFDAKVPGTAFEPDTERKRRQATEDVRAAALSIRPVFERLERRRRSQLVITTGP